MKKIMVSGFFDGLHVGHIDFLSKASSLGSLIVCVGSDENHLTLYKSYTLNSQNDRIAILRAITYTDLVIPAGGRGITDFEQNLKDQQPDIFLVSEKGDCTEKQNLCNKYGIKYKVLSILSEAPTLSKKTFQTNDWRIPSRISLVGGWIDQPWISSLHKGSMVVVRIQPFGNLSNRSGMATSTRTTAKKIWADRLPTGNHENVARILFGAENPPGSKYISGSQDAIGITYPGVSRLDYNGGFWPTHIENCIQPKTVEWLESVLYLVPLEPRKNDYNPLIKKNITKQGCKLLGDTGDTCWKAIQNQDVKLLGSSLNQTLTAWKNLLPNTVPSYIQSKLEAYQGHAGVSLTGAGGGYILIASNDKPENSFQIKISTN